MVGPRRLPSRGGGARAGLRDGVQESAELILARRVMDYFSLASGPLRLETACRSMNSICAFTLRKSSAAHFSISFHNSGGILSRKGLRASKDRLSCTKSRY